MHQRINTTQRFTLQTINIRLISNEMKRCYYDRQCSTSESNS